MGKRILRAVRWAATILVGVVPWMAGFCILRVPPTIEDWRIVAGATLICIGVMVWEAA